MVLTTRRELMVALLGTSACRWPFDKTPELEGGFVGPSMEAGHRLRDNAAPAPAPQTAEQREIPILILGAGVSGLAAAWQLSRAGRRDFAIIELEPTAGGTAASGRTGALRYPWGAHYLPIPDAANSDLIELLEETGTVTGRDSRGQPVFEETHLCGAPTERVYHQGFWHEGLYPTAGASSADLDQLARFEREIDRLVAFRDAGGRRAFTLPMAGSSDDPAIAALDEMSFAEWLRRSSFDSPRLRWYTEYACRDDYGTELSEVSAWAGLFYFAARRERPEERSAEYLTWPEGNAFLVDHMVARIGPDRLHTGELVFAISPAEPDGRRVKVVTWSPTANRSRAWIAERVIFALPSFLRRYLLPNAPAFHPRYSPWLVANIHLRGRPSSRGYPQAWDNVIHGSRSLGYVVATHQQHSDRGPTVWTYYLPLSGPDETQARRDLASLTWKEACTLIAAELSSCHENFETLAERIDIARWGHAMVRPVTGSIFSAERRAAQNPSGPIHFAHTDLSGMALFEEAFHHGTRAAREVL